MRDGRRYEPIGNEFYYSSNKLYFHYFGMFENQLSAVRIWQPGYATPQGIRIGDSKELIAATYELVMPNPTFEDEDRMDAYNPERDRAMTQVSEDVWLAFYFTNNSRNVYNSNFLEGWSYGVKYHWEPRN